MADYRVLLKKYIQLIIDEEGVDYLDYVGSSWSKHEGKNFTETELDEVRRVAKEARVEMYPEPQRDGMMSNDYLGLQWHLDMMKAARERWPDIAEHPRLVGVSPGCAGLDMAMMCDPAPLKANLPDRLLEERPLIKAEHISLEPVGVYWMGYGPQTETLAIRQGVPA